MANAQGIGSCLIATFVSRPQFASRIPPDMADKYDCGFELWQPDVRATLSDMGNARRRYHYQYAVFSVSGFSKPAQDYAFAQDVYLLPLRENRFVGPVVQAVDDFAKAAEDEDGAEPLGELRKRVRRRLRGEMAFESRRNDEPGSEEDRFVGAVHMVDFALLAMIGNQFPVFMVPSPDMVSRGLTELRDEQPIRVRVYWDQDGWYLRRANRNEEVLFSFDLPEALFLRYADGGILTRASALRLKGEQLSRFQAFWIIDDRLELLTFELDQAWLDDVRQQLRQQ